MLDSQLFNGDTALTTYRSEVWRVVESQEDVATLSIVDDLAEQALLEALLDAHAKPRYREGTEQMHYLLKTAFRYPPLRWGSRFGTTLMPSYFYASEEASTALCECAYYRFLFLADMVEPYIESIRSQYALFKVMVSSSAALDLTSVTFKSIHDGLRAPDSYAVSQQVGRWAYDSAQVALIRYESARQASGINVAIHDPSAIRSRKPQLQQRWLCLTKPDSVSFSSRESDTSYLFKRREFTDAHGRLLRVSV